MTFIKRLAVLFFVTLNMFIANTILLYVANVLEYEDFTSIFYLAYFDDNTRLVFVVIAGIILLMNFFFYKLFTINIHRDKTIAFDNPQGRVTVSLLALEDLIKRCTHQIDEIKDAKSSIVASKKGLFVKIRLSIRSDVSIPEATSQVQDLIKDKIHDTIGLDENVHINVYVSKIVSETILHTKDDKKKKDKKEKKGDDSEPNIPFQGYRA